jgi:hypothetical protein
MSSRIWHCSSLVEIYRSFVEAAVVMFWVEERRQEKNCVGNIVSSSRFFSRTVYCFVRRFFPEDSAVFSEVKFKLTEQCILHIYRREYPSSYPPSMPVNYLFVVSRSIVCPFLRQKTVGSGWPFGGLHSIRAVSPSATLVLLGSARKSSRRTANRDVKDQVVFVLVLVYCVMQLIRITDNEKLNTSDQTNALTRYTPLCALPLGEQMFAMWRALYTKYRWWWQISPPLWIAKWIINKGTHWPYKNNSDTKIYATLNFYKNNHPEIWYTFYLV